MVIDLNPCILHLNLTLYSERLTADFSYKCSLNTASDLMTAPASNFQFSWLGLDDLSLVGPIGV